MDNRIATLTTGRKISGIIVSARRRKGTLTGNGDVSPSVTMRDKR